MTNHTPVANSSSQRVIVCLISFALASLSFACLLGHMYGFWNMKVFAPCVLIPSTLALVVMAVSTWGRKSGARPLIVEGAIGGLVAAIAYDAFRYPFVKAGYPLFGVFPKFGQLLLYGKLLKPTDPDANSLAVNIAGWLYHFSNGMALGIMFLGLVYLITTRPSRQALLGGGAIWAVAVEIFLLLSPYYHFLGVDKKMSFQTFLILTLSAHLIFGLFLGWYCLRRMPRHEPFAPRLA